MKYCWNQNVYTERKRGGKIEKHLEKTQWRALKKSHNGLFFFPSNFVWTILLGKTVVILHVCVNLYINTILSLIILGCFYTAELWFNFIYLMCTFSLVVLFIFHRFLYNLCIEQEQSVGWELSDQISRSVVSDSFRPHESQHARPPCPSPTPRVHSDSHPSSQ